MSSDSSKAEKKRLKAEVKRAKAEAKYRSKAEAKYRSKAGRPPGATIDGDQSTSGDRRSFGSTLLRFAREGLFQTIIKVIAGLIVAYLLIRLGLR